MMSGVASWLVSRVGMACGPVPTLRDPAWYVGTNLDSLSTAT